jgi:sugar (pentulose or hexulose) kinase
MSVSLLLDLGTSRLKAVLYDRDSRRMLAGCQVAAPLPRYGAGGEIEIAGDAHPRMVGELCEGLFREAGCVPDQAVMCSKMHGFLLESADRASLYISWRDERAARSGVLDELKAELGDDFRAITGMRLRAGLPFVTLCHVARHGGLPAKSRVLSLAEWVVSRLGELTPVTDESLAAGLGTYDLGRGAWSAPLLERISREGAAVPAFLDPVPAGRSPLGQLRLAGRDIPVLAAVGDLQAAVFGSGCPPVTALCINIGTGSQINRIGVQPADSFVEVRPFLDSSRMSTISHMPAGRAFRVLEEFFEQVAPGGGMAFWRLAGAMSESEIGEAVLDVDLNCFSGAWRYQNGGAIRGIHEGRFSPHDVVAGAVRALAEQYLDAIAMIDPANETDELVLCGGMARRLPAFARWLAGRAGRRLTLVDDGEETLAGLVRIIHLHED